MKYLVTLQYEVDAVSRADALTKVARFHSNATYKFQQRTSDKPEVRNIKTKSIEHDLFAHLGDQP
jgi:hypothetical protein